MVKLRALVPDATVNYIKNPAMRYDTTDWNVQGATISRVLTRARFGIASLKVVTAGSALHEGAFFRVSSLSGVSEPITVSAYVRGTGKVRIRLDNNVVGGNEFYSEGVELTDERWTRIQMLGFSTGGNDLRLFVETDEDAAVARTFYVDGAQLERKSYATTYCDGDQEGCRWNGIYHNSTSQRGNDTRAGGKWIELSGPDREAEDLYMTVAGGLGMAPLRNNTQSFALAPGGYFSNKKVNMRVTTFTFHAKHKVDDIDQPVSLAHLHNLRQMLIDIVKPDKTGGDEDILFEYDDGTVPLYFRARYDGGLEGDWDVRNQFVNSFPLRLLSTSPIMEEDSQEAMELDFQDSTPVSRIMGRFNGSWAINNLNYGLSATAYRMALGPRGEIYAVGAFITANNNANAIDPLRTVNYVAKWDGEKWNALGTGLIDEANDIAIGPNGYVYVTGEFTSASGVPASYVAFWDGTNWNAMGAGLDNSGNAIAVAPNGDVYVGGAFTTAGGVSCARIARWDGYQWRRVGQYGGLNGTVTAIAIEEDGNSLYVGGSFTDQNGLAANGLLYVASYNISTGLFSSMGNVFNAVVRDIIITRSGSVVAGGNFSVSASSISNVAIWNGGQWESLGTGVNGAVYAIREDDAGNILLSGNFTAAGSIDIPGKFAIWNGSYILPLDVKYVKGTITVESILVTKNNDYVVSGGFVVGTSSIICSGITTITNNGSSEAYPIIYCKGPGKLLWFENLTTQKRMYINLSLFTGEEIFIDTGDGTFRSSNRGNTLYALLPGSDFRSFTLRPGENRIACFITDDVNAQMSLQFQPKHWSVDATQRGEDV